MPGREAGLAEQGRLLVAGDPADRDAGGQARARPARGDAEAPARRTHLGQGSRRGTPNSSASSLSQRQRRMSNSRVRLALVGVGGVDGARRSGCHSSQLSTVPKARSGPGRDAALGRTATRSLVAEKYGSRTSPVRRRTRSRWPAAAGASQTRGGPPVLPHDGPVQRPAGAAVPHHGRLPLVGDADGGHRARRSSASSSARVAATASQISSASCSTQPGRGKYWGNSR